MTNMKSCPFCGGGAIEVCAWETSTDISCLDCDYTIKCHDCDEEDAIDYWNRRPANAALIAAAQEMLEMLDNVGSDLAVAFASTPGIESKIWQDILKEDIQKICAVLKKARGEE